MSVFDRKFGKGFCEEIPPLPGVYTFLNGEKVIYVGKAKNLRRRLSQYRHPTRLKKHRRMRAILRHATSLTLETCATEVEALLLENQKIQTLRPRFNLAGAYSFLYPCVGWSTHSGVWTFELSRRPASRMDLEWFGAFRSRSLAREGMQALQRLLFLLGHPEGKKQTYWRFRVRGVPLALEQSLRDFFWGESAEFLSTLSLQLLERAQARGRAQEVQADLRTLLEFYHLESRPLAQARVKTQTPRRFIEQQERDPLFLRSKDFVRTPESSDLATQPRSAQSSLNSEA